MNLPVKFLRVAVLSVAVSCLCVVGAAAANLSLGVGTVEADALRLREEPNAESTILDTAPNGAVVVVLEDAGDNWYKVDYNTVEGYMSGEYLTVSEKADVSIGYGLVSTDGSILNVRGGPGTDCQKVTSLNNGTVVSIVGIDSGWYKISHGDTTGYVSSEYMVTTKDSAGSRSGGSSVAAYSASSAPVAASSIGQQAANYAQQFLGVPYSWGGNGPSTFDCSGFTKYIFKQFGYTLNRTATDQLANGVSVSRGELQPGDLVFFRYNTSKPVSHVGIYLGGGQFIHASTTTYTVKIDSMSSGHYDRVFVYARRIL